MTRRTGWRAAFLGVTALAFAMELWAVHDGNPDTDPWTALITTYLDVEAAVALFGALMAWLAIHFWRRYRRKPDNEVR